VSWPIVQLGEAVNFVGGSQPPKSTFALKALDGYVRLLQIRDYKTDRYKTYIPIEKARKFCNKNDIMIGRYGPPIFQILRGLEGAYNVALMKAVPSGSVDSNYLFYFLKQDELFQLLDGLSQRTAGQSGVDMMTLKSYPMLLPPLPEQKRIAAILDKANAIRRKRKQAIDLADEFLRSVFLDMFGDPVTNPKGWESTTLSSIADVITGFAFKSSKYIDNSSSGVRLCRGANVLPNEFNWKDTKYYPLDEVKNLEGYKINDGDILLAMDRPWISSGLKVLCAKISDRDTYLVQRVTRIRCKNQAWQDFILAIIKSGLLKTHCKPTETTVPHISPLEINNLPIFDVDENLISKYGELTEKIQNLKNKIQRSQIDNENQFNALSQQAFAGKL